MDPILVAVALLILAIIVPILLATITVKLYLSAIGSFLLVSVSYLWLVENLTPLQSKSRTLKLGLCRAFPSEKDPEEILQRVETSKKRMTSYVFDSRSYVIRS
jgi:hypothetical protein